MAKCAGFRLKRLTTAGIGAPRVIDGGDFRAIGSSPFSSSLRLGSM